MKKVLILSASTGQGHNQAANSLKDAFLKNGFNVIKKDFLEGSSKLLLALVVGSYEVSAMKYPKLYGLFYRLTNIPLINGLSTIPFCLIKRRLLKVIKSENPDLIITTHPLSVCLINGLKRSGVKAPFISVVTDFKAHYTYISKGVDLYITGSEFTKDALVSFGINRNIIYPLGIPIKKSFFIVDDSIKALKNDDFFNILLMSGSMGLTDISYVLDELLKNEHKLRITVVCGNNKELKENLDKKLQSSFLNKKLHIVGFSNDISTFMDYSDVLISKPGGLTVTESVVKNLPLIIPFTIPGQETDNAKFLTSNGYSFSIDTLSDINPLINRIIDDKSILEKTKSNLKKLSDSYSIEEIIKISSDLIEKKHQK